MAGGAFDVAQMICILRITNPSLRSMTWLRCTKCLRADHLPGAGIEKVQREGTWGPCKKPISKKRTRSKNSSQICEGGLQIARVENFGPPPPQIRWIAANIAKLPELLEADPSRAD